MVALKDIPAYSENLPWPECWLSKIAKPISWLFITLGFSGWSVTLLSIAFGLFGAAVSASGCLLPGFLLFCCYALLDNSDGQVARYNKEPSNAGIYIDSRTHFIVEPLFFIGLGFGSALIPQYRSWGIYFIIAGFASALFYLMRQTMKTGDLGYPESGTRRLDNETTIIGKIKYLIFNTIRINNPFGLMLWAIIFGVSGYALFLYAVLFAINTISCFIGKFNELRN